MNRVKILITISAFSLLVLCLPAIASAQYGGYGNGGYNNGGYGNNGYYGDIRSTIRDLKNRSKNFNVKSIAKTAAFSAAITGITTVI